MFNHNKVPWWRRLIGLSAVCMVCNLSAIMPSHASMCLVYDADNPDCVDSQNYASVLSSFCDSEDAIDINSKEYKDLIDSSYKCTELQDCPGKATCTPPDCQSLNFNDYGKDFEFSDKYTSGKGNNRTINPEAAAKYNDWPAGKVVDGHNDTEHWACYICEFVGKNGKVVRPKQKNVEGVNVHSWQCARVDICAEGDTAYPRDGQSFDDFVKDQQEKCAENNEGNQLWKFIVGKSNDSSYYCGHCEVETIAGCSSGVPETNMPIGVTCYDKCGEGNSKFTGERTTLADGTKDVRCCIFGEMNTKCPCDADAIAQYDPEKPTNAECSGHAWNNGVANIDPAQPACSCVVKPCEDGSDTIDDNNPPQGPNAQGYYTVKKDGKCYAKKFNNWHGDDACYKDVEMTEENGFGCEEGMVFDEDKCECVPLCPDPGITCNEAAIAKYDPQQQNNAGCTGHAWNDYFGTAAKEIYGDDNTQETCSIILKPCDKDAAVIDENNVPQGPNAQGYYTVKKDGKCYVKSFTNWHGDDACYKDVEMTKENGFGCADGEEFSTDTCECLPPACPEGWSIYAQEITPIYQPYASNASQSDSKGMITGYSYKELPGRFLFGADSANKTLDLATAAKSAVFEGCYSRNDKYGRKGWQIVYADEKGKTYRSALKVGDKYAIGADGKYQVYQCGYCAPKTCKDGVEEQKKGADGKPSKNSEDYTLEFNKDESANITPESHCFGSSKLHKTYVDKYQGDEQCVTCPWCWDVDSVRNDCYEQIVNDNLVTCWSEKGDRFGDTIRPICSCAGTDYYENCYMLKPDATCSFYSKWSDETANNCTLAAVTANEVTTGKVRNPLKYTREADGKVKSEIVKISYKNPYIISQCQHLAERGNTADSDYVVAYISECTASKNCAGHGPAWNPEANDGKGAAMVPLTQCKADKYGYGLMYEGRKPVACGGVDWYDECASADVCKATHEEHQEAINNCPDGECVIEGVDVTAEFDVTYYDDNAVNFGDGYLWDTDSSGYPRLLDSKACSREGAGYERWYLKYCDLGGHDISELEEIEDIDEFKHTHSCTGEVETYVCGNAGNTMTFVFNKNSEGEDVCTEIDQGTGKDQCPTTAECYNGEWVEAADGTKYCTGECLTQKCGDTEYCDVPLKNGYCSNKCLPQCTGDTYCNGTAITVNDKTYCDGKCEGFMCANVSKCYDALSYRCNYNDGCVDQVYKSTDGNIGMNTTIDVGAGRYIAGLACSPDATALSHGVEYVYAIALCNSGVDCLGNTSPAADRIECSNGAVDGATPVICGGISYYYPQDCIGYEPPAEAPSDEWPAIVGGMYSEDSTIPERYEDTGYTYTLNDKKMYYFAQCDTAYKITQFGVEVKSGSGSALGWADCGLADTPGIKVKEGFSSTVCGKHLYAQKDGNRSTCMTKCNYDWTKSTCEAVVQGSYHGTFIPDNEGCQGQYGSCAIDGITLSSKEVFTDVFNSGWCSKSKDPNWANHNCGNMLKD